MRPEVQALVRLQELDHSITKLEAELMELPKRLDALKAEVATQAKLLEQLQASLKADEAERKKLEIAVELHKSKIIKLKKQLLEAQNETHTRAFEHEITWALDEISKAEERELELLMEEEQLRVDVAAAQVKLTEMQKSFEGERQTALARHKAGRVEIETLQTGRSTTLKTLEPPMATLYERQRKKHRDGMVAAEALNSQCQGCHMEIRQQLWQELRMKQPFMQCESCGRVLYVIPVQ